MDEGKYACAGGEQRGTWAKRGRTRTRRFFTLLRGQSQRPRDAGGSTQKRCDPPQSRGLGPLGRFYLDGVTPLGDLPRGAFCCSFVGLPSGLVGANMEIFV